MSSSKLMARSSAVSESTAARDASVSRRRSHLLVAIRSVSPPMWRYSCARIAFAPATMPPHSSPSMDDELSRDWTRSMAETGVPTALSSIGVKVQ